MPIHGRKDPSPHRLGLAGVFLQTHDGETRRIFVAKRLEQTQSAVAAAVVDEAELDPHAVDGERAKLVDRQPALFVIAGDDQDQVHGAHSRICRRGNDGRPPAGRCDRRR
jgi:hypothetical protein